MNEIQGGSSMSAVDVYIPDERLIAILRKSTTEFEVEDSFIKFNVSSCEDKIKYLNEAMYSPQTFYSAGSELPLEQRYALALQMFLAGTWKLYTYYEKLGLGKAHV